MNKPRSLRLFLVAAGIILINGTLLSQSSISSPYSHYGIGDIHNLSNTRGKTMGGISYASRGSYNLSPKNPASYTSIDTLTFVFEAGIASNFVTLKTSGLTEQASSAHPSHLFFGFPVTRWLKIGFGAAPFSAVGYKILDEVTDPLMGKIHYYYEGDGGLNQYFLGSGISLGNRISLGFNLIYMAGRLERSRMLHFPDSTAVLNTRVRSTIHISDISFNAGIQYHTPLGKDKSLTLGLAASNGNSLNATGEQLTETLFGGINGGYEIFSDTIEYLSGIEGDLRLPLTIGGGFLYEKTDHISAGADISYGFWNNYRLMGQNDSLQNSLNIHTGAEFIPNNSSVSKYWKKIRYRGGISYSKTYLELNKKQINDLGFAIGFGLPLRRQAATLNFGAEFGSRGTTQSNLIQENYLRFFFGISITERWFIKRKYN